MNGSPRKAEKRVFFKLLTEGCMSISTSSKRLLMYNTAHQGDHKTIYQLENASRKASSTLGEGFRQELAKNNSHM